MSNTRFVRKLVSSKLSSLYYKTTLVFSSIEPVKSCYRASFLLILTVMSMMENGKMIKLMAMETIITLMELGMNMLKFQKLVLLRRLVHRVKAEGSQVSQRGSPT